MTSYADVKAPPSCVHPPGTCVSVAMISVVIGDDAGAVVIGCHAVVFPAKRLPVAAIIVFTSSRCEALSCV